jgi:tetratricopeptide (TPR) repeat protein
MEIFRHVYGADTKHVNVANVLMSLGVVDYAIGKKEESRSKCKEALGMFRYLYGADTKHVNVARLLEILTILDTDLGDKEEARLKYQEALEIYRHIRCRHQARECGQSSQQPWRDRQRPW